MGRSLDPPDASSRDIQTPRPCESGDFRAGGDAEGDVEGDAEGDAKGDAAGDVGAMTAIMIAPTIPDVPVFGHGRRAGSEHELEAKTRPCTGEDEAASAAAPEAPPNDPRNSARCQITRHVEGRCIRGRGGGNGLTIKRPQGTFWGMDTQHGPSHSDHMEDRMRYSGYFEMRNEKLREQGVALRREDDASSRAIASVYHNLAARLIENCPAERNKMALEEETRSHKRPRDEMDENGGGKARAGLSTWWESSCGHAVRLLRPKGELARSTDIWQVRVYGPSVVEQNGYKSLTCRANLEAALNKAARYLKVPVNNLVSSKEKKASGLSLPSRAGTETSGALKGMEGACETKQNSVEVGGKPLVEASKQAASRGELSLFNGKVVYFDGRTGDHSALHLSKLVMLHGGACSVTLLHRWGFRGSCLTLSVHQCIYLLTCSTHRNLLCCWQPPRCPHHSHSAFSQKSHACDLREFVWFENAQGHEFHQSGQVRPAGVDIGLDQTRFENVVLFLLHLKLCCKLESIPARPLPRKRLCCWS